MVNKELQTLIETAEQRGIVKGIQMMQQKMLSACEKGTPVELFNGRLYWIQNDIEHLNQVMDSLGK